MGRCPNHKNSKKKGYSHKSARRAKFLVKGDDAIYNELQRTNPQARILDDDLPGRGQFYCLHCDRYFGSAAIRNDHLKTKRHKKRLKSMQDMPHSQLDAELAAGMGRPDNGPKLREFDISVGL